MAPTPTTTRKDAAAEVQAADQQLLAYLKARIEEFEVERSTLLERVDRCSVQASDHHRIEWENRKRADEMRELQKALSDAHAFLFEERQRLLTLQAENDELRLQEIQDRKHIQQLLALSQGPGSASGRPAQPSMQPSNDHLLLRIESLQAQLSEQAQLASERMAALVEDRRIREAEEVAHRSLLNQQLEALAAKASKADETLRQTTKDFILARREKQAAEQRAQEAEVLLAQEKHAAADKLYQVRRKAAEELSQTKGSADAKLDDVAGNLRKQLKAKEEELASLSNVHSSVSSQYERRVAELEAKCNRLGEANRQLEMRRHMDMEGFTSDVTNLRKQLTAVERKLHETRLVDRIQDDDRLDTLLQHLRKKTLLSSPGGIDHAQDLGSGRSEASSIKGKLAEGLGGARSRVAELEERLGQRKKALAAERDTGRKM